MDISSLNNYFELYGGMAIFIVVLLEYMNLPGFPAGIIMPLAGIYAAHGGISLLAAIAISVLAGEVGSWILYFLGMYGGNAFLKIYLKSLQNKANQGNLLGESILDFAQRQVIQRYLNHFLEKYLKKSYEAEHWLMMHLNRTSYPVLAKEY